MALTVDIQLITNVLNTNDDVIFAYLYGSVVTDEHPNDIDIAVFTRDTVEPHTVSADLKISLAEVTRIPVDDFDIRVINDLPEKSDIFGLLYLKRVLEGGQLLVNKKPESRAEILERYGTRYRECEGLIQEVLA